MMKRSDHLIFNLVLMVALLAADTNAQDWQSPRTEYGHPDLQGIWSNATQTRLERDTALGEQQTFTEAEARAREKLSQERDIQADQASDPDHQWQVPHIDDYRPSQRSDSLFASCRATSLAAAAVVAAVWRRRIRWTRTADYWRALSLVLGFSYLELQRWATDDAGHLQQQLPNCANPRLCCHHGGDDSRRAHYKAPR